MFQSSLIASNIILCEEQKYMKRVLNPIHANAGLSDRESTLTSFEVVLLLQEIEELQGLEIGANETDSGVIQFVVGENIYDIET